MKQFILFLVFLFVPIALAQTAVPTITVAVPAAVAPVPTPVVAGVTPNNGDGLQPLQWVTEFITTVQALPVVGPIASRILVYLGILGSIMTALVSFLIVVLTSLQGVSSFAGLASFESKIEAFKNSKIMYWLACLSLFNAKPPAPPQTIADAVKVTT